MKTNFMVFIAGDNNLDMAGQNDIKEMLAVEETGDDINIIVQYDQSEMSESATTKRYVIQDGKKIVNMDIGETNTGDVNTLRDFLTWGMENYPADRNIVILWNHGGGASDDLPWYSNNTGVPARSIERAGVSRRTGNIRALTPNPALGNEPSLFPQPLRLKRLGGLIEEYQKEMGGPAESPDENITRSILLDDDSRDFVDNLELKDVFSDFEGKIDIIGFDACLMNMMEVAYQLKDSAKVIVGSEETEPGAGWDYEAILRYLAENPEADNDDISRKIVSSYIDFYKKSGSEEGLTLSSIRTDALAHVAECMNSFAYAVLQHEPNIFKTLRNIVDDVEYFSDEDLYFDLFHFVTLTKAYYSEEEHFQEDIRKAADELLEAIEASVIENKTIRHDNAHGISVYLGTYARMSPLAMNIFSKLDINGEKGAPYWYELFQAMGRRH